MISLWHERSSDSLALMRWVWLKALCDIDTTRWPNRQKNMFVVVACDSLLMFPVIDTTVIIPVWLQKNLSLQWIVKRKPVGIFLQSSSSDPWYALTFVPTKTNDQHSAHPRSSLFTRSVVQNEPQLNMTLANCHRTWCLALHPQKGGGRWRTW